MRLVQQEELVPGQVLPHALYTRGGRLLAHSGTILSQEMAEFLQCEGPDVLTGVLMWDTRAEPMGVRPIAEGTGTPDGAALNGLGVIAAMDKDQADWDRRLMRNRIELRRSCEGLVRMARTLWEGMPLSVLTGLDPVRPVRCAAWLYEKIPNPLDEEFIQMRRSGVRLLGDVYARLLDSQDVTCGVVVELAEELIDALCRHAPLYPIAAIGLPRPQDSLPDHGYTCGAVAIAVAAQLGWPRAEVRNVGMAGMLSDCGMALSPHPIRRSDRPLTDIERNALRRHPEYSLAMLRGMRGLPEPVVMSAFQHHERCDGSGYPLGSKADRLHDYSRVIMVAEAFAAMTAPRAHRMALTPAAAMSELAHLARAGAFDREVVRALVDVMGLYPARSFVKLSTGHIAMVGAGSRPGQSDRPVVHVVLPVDKGMGRFGRPIDLAQDQPRRLRITEAVRIPEGVEV